MVSGQFLNRRLLLAAILLLLLSCTVAAQEQILDKILTFGRQRTSIYEALNVISAKADCFFVYDSKLVNSEKRVKLEADHLPLRLVLDRLLGNPELKYRVIGQHILIYKENAIPLVAVRDSVPVIPARPKPELLIKGHVFDNSDQSPLAFTSIGIAENNIGTVANADGYFVLKIPAEFAEASLLVSHLGYISRNVPLCLLSGSLADLYLDRRVISMQEVIIRYLDPRSIIQKAVQQRGAYCNPGPVYITSFYREGVQKNNRFLSYSEAVFRIYKPSFREANEPEQVKLLKSRKIQNALKNDTVYLKLKGGVLSGLQLDIVKYLPGFLDEEQLAAYTFGYSDLVSNDYRNAYAISFVQKPGIAEPLYKGTLFVDRESYAILGADFEVNPDYLYLAANDLILHKSRKLRVKLERIGYSVSYNQYNGRYYLNHVRCDLNLKTRLHNHLSSDNFNTFLELANCRIDTLNVCRFGKEETLKTNVVFSDIPVSYDDTFWGDYNIIVPEEKLNAALMRIIPKIEEIR